MFDFSPPSLSSVHVPSFKCQLRSKQVWHWFNSTVQVKNVTNHNTMTLKVIKCHTMKTEPKPYYMIQVLVICGIVTLQRIQTECTFEIRKPWNMHGPENVILHPLLKQVTDFWS